MADDPRPIEINTEARSSTSTAFILGGVVVALGIIGWLVFGGNSMPSSSAPYGAAKTSITIDNTAPAPAAPAPAAPAPAPAAPAAPAPAAPAPAAPATAP